MSDPNGKPLTFDEAKAQYRQLRLETKLAEAKIHKQLLESFTFWPSFTGTGWGDWVDPMDRFRDGSKLLAPLRAPLSDRRQPTGGDFVQSEAELDAVRGVARLLVRSNLLAEGVLLNLRNFTIRGGYQYQAIPERKAKSDPQVKQALADQVQEVLQEFFDGNTWSEREKKIFWRSRRDGEMFLRRFAAPDGLTTVRTVEPEFVRQPTPAQLKTARWPDELDSHELAGADWSWGIATEPDDVETVLAYAVQYRPEQPFEIVASDEIHHLKLNVDETIKRGFSDFYTTRDALDGTLGLLRNMREGGKVQAAIVGIRQHETLSKASAESWQQDLASKLFQGVINPNTGQPANVSYYPPGSILDVSKGITYQPNAWTSAGAPNFVAIVQSCLRAAGARWAMPEYMVSGFMGNVAELSILAAGSPFVVNIETEQVTYRDYFLGVLWQVIARAAAVGRFRVNGQAVSFATVRKLVEVQCEPPQVAIADELQQTQSDHMDLQAGVMSKQTRRKRIGLDDDQEIENLRQEPVATPAPAPAPSEGPRFFPRLNTGSA